jgi:hypothetical protein
MSVHQAPQKKQKSNRWELVFGNYGTTFDPTFFKKKSAITHVQCTVTVQNAQ